MTMNHCLLPSFCSLLTDPFNSLHFNSFSAINLFTRNISVYITIEHLHAFDLILLFKYIVFLDFVRLRIEFIVHCCFDFCAQFVEELKSKVWICDCMVNMGFTILFLVLTIVGVVDNVV